MLWQVQLLHSVNIVLVPRHAKSGRNCRVAGSETGLWEPRVPRIVHNPGGQECAAPGVRGCLASDVQTIPVQHVQHAGAAWASVIVSRAIGVRRRVWRSGVSAA